MHMLSWTRLDLDLEALRHVAEAADRHRVHVAVAVAAIASGLAGSAFWITLFTVIVAITLWLDLQTTRRHYLACSGEVQATEAPLANLRRRQTMLQTKLEAAQARLAEAENAKQTLLTNLQQRSRNSICSERSEVSDTKVPMETSPPPMETSPPPISKCRAHKVLRISSMYALQKVELRQLEQACEALVTCVRWAHTKPGEAAPPPRRQKVAAKTPESSFSPPAAQQQSVEEDLPEASEGSENEQQAPIFRCGSLLSSTSLDCNVPQEGSLLPMPTTPFTIGSIPSTPARSVSAMSVADSPSMPFREDLGITGTSSTSNTSSPVALHHQVQLDDDETVISEDPNRCAKDEHFGDDGDDDEEFQESPSRQRIAFSLDGSRGVRGIIPAGRADREQAMPPRCTTSMATTMPGISSAMGTEAISSVFESLQGTMDSSIASFKDTASRYWTFGSQ